MLSVLLLTVVGVAIHSNSFDASFHLDDASSIVDNDEIRKLISKVSLSATGLYFS
jgi:hypothetical protein